MDEIFKMLEDIRPEFDFRNSENFIEDGALDSFDVITLVDMLEEKYGVKIDGLDIVPENFFGANQILALLRKNGAAV